MRGKSGKNRSWLRSYLKSLQSHGLELLAVCICIGLGVAATTLLLRGISGDSASFDNWDSTVACNSRILRTEACEIGEFLEVLKEMGTIAAAVAAVPFLMANWIMAHKALIER